MNTPNPEKLERERHQIKLKNKILIKRFLLGKLTKPMKHSKKEEPSMSGIDKQYITLDLEPSDSRLNPKKKSNLDLILNALFLIILLVLFLLIFESFRK